MMDSGKKKSSYKYILLSLIIPSLIIATKPLGMDLRQSLVLASLLLVLIWWTSGIVNKNIASIFLLLSFTYLSNFAFKTVYKFPLSDDFLMIILSFLLSQGIVNSNLARSFGNFILSKFIRNGYDLIIVTFILAILLIFIIPQPFSRAIIIASILEEFLKGKKITERTKKVFMFSSFVAATSSYMFFKNGDIILNNAALSFADISISWIQWAKIMTLPSLITAILIIFIIILTFKKEISSFSLEEENGNKEYNEINPKLSREEKVTSFIMAIVVFLWLTESFHGISSTTVSLIGTTLMFSFKVLSIRDFKSINWGLMIFLTAAFSIGGVMNESGLASILYEKMIRIFPDAFSYKYIFIIIISTMILHMLLGSTVTSLSVILPSLTVLSKGLLDPSILVFLVYITVNLHYILPFHHVSIMIGSGNDYYPNELVIKYGLVITLIIFVIIYLVFIPWWKFIGFL